VESYDLMFRGVISKDQLVVSVIIHISIAEQNRIEFNSTELKFIYIR
jgi:hypothetical protein